MTAEMAFLCFLSLIVLRVSADIKQHLKKLVNSSELRLSEAV